MRNGQPLAINCGCLRHPVVVATLNLFQRLYKVAHIDEALGEEIGDRVPELDNIRPGTGLDGRGRTWLKIRPVDEVSGHFDAILFAKGLRLLSEEILRRRNESGTGKDVQAAALKNRRKWTGSGRPARGAKHRGGRRTRETKCGCTPDNAPAGETHGCRFPYQLLRSILVHEQFPFENPGFPSWEPGRMILPAVTKPIGGILLRHSRHNLMALARLCEDVDGHRILCAKAGWHRSSW